MAKLFTPDPTRIGRPAGPASVDAVPPDLLDGTPTKLRQELVELLGKDRVLHRLIDLVRYASDASPYRYVPQVVVMPRNLEEVLKIMNYCRVSGRHATFRAAGTSMNGQSQSDDILIDVRRYWSGCRVLDEGRRVIAKPGTILGHVNEMLARYGRKLGPDPASAHAATIGGVIANNSGGMRCTLERDAYHTVKHVVFALPSGTVIDTSAPDAEARFKAAEPALASGLMELRVELLADEALTARVRRKYSIRNTHGYRICALLDGETPLEIFKRLIVGSEGTLAFVAEATIDSIETAKVSGVAFLMFGSIDAAIERVSSLVKAGAAAVELMMAPALTAAGGAIEGTPKYWRTLDPKAAALLVEFGATDMQALEAKEAEVRELVADAHLLQPVTFTSVEEAVELAWHVREGLLGLVGKLRPQGSMLVTEDVCFPRERLAEAAHDLQALMAKHGFIPGVAGHAAHGNLHFLLIARFDEEEGRKRYSAFMDELVDLVVRKHDGSLKAEHGTGINMAPFIEAEWGEKATRMMWRIKELADPQGILGKNVLLTKNANVHLESMKSVPLIEDVEGASHCIECGFCEPVCPSRNVTTTPRQRIVLRREMARQPDNSPLLRRLQEDYEYDAIQTCAGDGSCSIPCPIGINTGSLMREFRKTERTEREKNIALSIAKRWDTVESLSRTGLGAAEIIYRIAGVAPLKAITGLARSMVCEDLIPAVPGPMPRPAKPLPTTEAKGADAVYFPACINRMFGRDPSKPAGPSLAEALIEVSARAGKKLWIPDDVAGQCCSTPFKSKGYQAAHDHMATAMADSLWRWTDGGRLPVVVDAASCTLGILQDVPKALDDPRRERFEKIKIIDSVSWVKDLLHKLDIRKKLDRVVLHPTCSMNHLHLAHAFHEVAEQLSNEVIVPLGAACCGTAGDRGLLHPELVLSATRDERESVMSMDADAYLSANRTCEMGMRHSTGKSYESFVFVVEELTRPSNRS